MIATVGRTVQYMLTQDDCDEVGRRRTTGIEIAERIKAKKWPLGAQAHVGSAVTPGDILPMLIVKIVEPNAGVVNGRVFLDGSDELWVRERAQAMPQATVRGGRWFEIS